MVFKNVLLFCFIVLSIFSFNNCSSNSQTMDNKENISKDKLKEFADEKFGNQYSIHYNQDSSYAIVKKQTKAGKNEPFLSTSFFIYGMNGQNIIYQQVIHRGDAKWYNNNLVEINSIPGIIKGDESTSTKSYYDVLSKKKLKTPGEKRIEN